jgi:uridine kinase
MSGIDRRRVLDRLSRMILSADYARPVRVAIDGRTASGKTTFADELATTIGRRGRTVIRTSIDGFHRPKIERYARGRYSAEGYYFDARDLVAIRACLLDPLGPGGDRQYRTESFDLENDVPIDVPAVVAPIDGILIVDGTFLQRPELASGWDITVFLRTSEEISERRGVDRDVEQLGGTEPTRRLYAERYLPAFALYDTLCRPETIADVVIDNDDLEHPVIHVRPGGRLPSLA